MISKKPKMLKVEVKENFVSICFKSEQYGFVQARLLEYNSEIFIELIDSSQIIFCQIRSLHQYLKEQPYVYY